MALGPGSTLAGFRIERQLGRGGMGVVYLATQLQLERKVALKLVAPEFAEDGDFRTRFIAESRTAAALEHAHVLPVYEAGEADGNLYIAMRYVEGTDLSRLLKEQERLDPRRAVRLVAQMAEALDAAHAHGLVHRDVKPANVLLTRDDHAYLTDFGLSKRIDSKSGVTRTGQFVGTFDYMAPEQIEGGPLSAQTDVYSLGCVLFHVLTGRVPYERDRDVAKIWAHVSGPPPSLLETAPWLPPELEDVVSRAMA
jgi:serine/threonine-protein kinase